MAKISDLKKGDVVFHYGMRLQLAENPIQHEKLYGLREGTPRFYYTAKALITNWEQVKHFVGNLADKEGDQRFWGMQSNDLAVWTQK